VVEEVTEVMDWRSVLSRHPCVLVGSAMLAGCLIVPPTQEEGFRS
jgi:hypothetical protein